MKVSVSSSSTKGPKMTINTKNKTNNDNNENKNNKVKKEKRDVPSWVDREMVEKAVVEETMKKSDLQHRRKT